MKNKVHFKTKISSYIVSFLCLLISALFFIEACNYCGVLIDLKQGDLNNYSGGFVLNTKKHYRNTGYILKLDNGIDLRVSLPNEYFFNGGEQLKHYKELKVQYSNQKFITYGGKRICISITTKDEEQILLNKTNVKKDVIFRAFFWSLISLLFISFFTLFLFVRFWPNTVFVILKKCYKITHKQKPH